MLMQQRNIKGSLISVIFIEVLGLLSGLLAGNINTDYENLIKPPFAPPGWLFGIAWAILYALMGLAIYRIYTSNAPQKDKSEALKLFILQLILNLIWPILFFRFGLLWVAAIELIILAVIVYITIKSFWKVDKIAAILLVPYLIWLIFAIYLNIGFAVLN